MAVRSLIAALHWTRVHPKLHTLTDLLHLHALTDLLPNLLPDLLRGTRLSFPPLHRCWAQLTLLGSKPKPKLVCVGYLYAFDLFVCPLAS